MPVFSFYQVFSQPGRLVTPPTTVVVGFFMDVCKNRTGHPRVVTCLPLTNYKKESPKNSTIACAIATAEDAIVNIATTGNTAIAVKSGRYYRYDHCCCKKKLFHYLLFLYYKDTMMGVLHNGRNKSFVKALT